ncbi:MAG: hypothetical protein M4579_001988 [Chaenotheca gracillima]|nr:MAG: hypothetical protein M4579_001988 [Chaenotheca gracillima]
MKRNPRKLKWTKSFRKAAGKELTVDSTLTFAARRNVPVRYNRDLVATTLRAMERVSDIRKRRERAFYKNRMRGNKARARADDRKLVEENEHLLPKEYKTKALTTPEEADVEAMEEVVTADAEPMTMRKEEAVVRQTRGAKAKTRRKLMVGGGVEDEGPAGDMDID